MEESAQGAGLARALRDVAASFFAMASTRMELATVEMREAAQRGVRLAVLGLAGAIFVLLALAFAGALVVVLFWDTHRVGAMASVLAAYAILGAALIARAVAIAREMPIAFEETRRALAADRDLFRTTA